MLQRICRRQPATVHGLAALFVCTLVALCAGQWHVETERSLEELQATRAALDQQTSVEGQTVTSAVQPQPFTPVNWPSRQSIDTLIQQAGQDATNSGLVVRSMLVSHHAATPSTWGKVSLEVSTSGSYGSSKAWQAALMQAFPSLAVQNLRLQPMPGSVGGVNGQWTWTLHVRD